MFNRFPFVLMRPIARKLGWSNGKMRFPDEVGGHGKWSMDRARHIIRAHYKLPASLNGRVVLVAPERAVDGRPAYRSVYWPGLWVGGLCKVSDRGDVYIEACWSVKYAIAYLIEVLLHEFGHAWLMMIKIVGHPALFDTDFPYWAQSRRATGISYLPDEESTKDDPSIIYETDEHGVRWIVHVDPVPNQPVKV